MCPGDGDTNPNLGSVRGFFRVDKTTPMRRWEVHLALGTATSPYYFAQRQGDVRTGPETITSARFGFDYHFRPMGKGSHVRIAAGIIGSRQKSFVEYYPTIPGFGSRTRVSVETNHESLQLSLTAGYQFIARGLALTPYVRPMFGIVSQGNVKSAWQGSREFPGDDVMESPLIPWTELGPLRLKPSAEAGIQLRAPHALPRWSVSVFANQDFFFSNWLAQGGVFENFTTGQQEIALATTRRKYSRVGVSVGFAFGKLRPRRPAQMTPEPGR